MAKKFSSETSEPQSLRVLMVEDSEDDALLTILALKKDGYDPVYERVEDAVTMQKALLEKPWDVILCDYQMPQFNGLAVINLLKETGIDIPLIIVSGAIGEETAVDCMHRGACDYIMKGNLTRLSSAIERELKEAESRLQRKQAEDALHKKEEIYRLITDNSNDWIYLINPDGKFKYVSPSSERITGYTPEEFMNNPERFLDIIHPDDKEQIKFHLETVHEKPEPHNLEFRITAKEGKLCWIRHTCLPVYNDQGQYSGRSGTNRDVTVRKLPEIQLKQTLESLRRSFGTTIQVMISAVESRDPYTSGHQKRSTDIARTIALEMGLSQETIEAIRMAGPIHDIGKLSVPAEILSKPGRLSQIEFSLIKEHARKGYEMLKDVESPWPLAEIVYQHHERMDGSGYPRNLKGDEILIEARIMAVADVVESMASHRPYRAALGINAALEEIEKNRGTHYDADVADACLRLFREKGFQIEGS